MGSSPTHSTFAHPEFNIVLETRLEVEISKLKYPTSDLSVPVNQMSHMMSPF